MITHSLAGFEPATIDYKRTTVHRSTNWAIEGLTNYFISCELLVHNYTSRAGFEPATYGLQTYFTTVHRSTNWAIEGLTNVNDISFHVNC